MKVTNYKNVELEDVNVEGAKNTKIRWLISQKDTAPNFAMRMFEVEVGGNTPYHTHKWEHEVFILKGEGALRTENGEKPFKAWDVVYVDPMKIHQFINKGDEKMYFLCVVPHQQEAVPKKKKSVNPFATGVANNC